jgi:hypothetical protein
VMRTELGFWSVLVGTVGVTGTAGVAALQTARKNALTCTAIAEGGCFGTHSTSASVSARLADLPIVLAAVVG